MSLCYPTQRPSFSKNKGKFWRFGQSSLSRVRALVLKLHHIVRLLRDPRLGTKTAERQRQRDSERERETGNGHDFRKENGPPEDRFPFEYLSRPSSPLLPGRYLHVNNAWCSQQESARFLPSFPFHRRVPGIGPSRTVTARPRRLPRLEGRSVLP